MRSSTLVVSGLFLLTLAGCSAGYSDAGDDDNAAALRQKGSVVESFGTAGTLTVPRPDGDFRIAPDGIGGAQGGIVELADHSILVMFAQSPLNNAAGTRPAPHTRVFKFRSDGSADTAFGAGAVVELPGALREGREGADGKIVLLAHDTAVRLDADGRLDSTFGTDGVLAYANVDRKCDLDAYFDASGGTYLYSGFCGIRGNDEDVFRIFHFDPDGHQIKTFGTNGFVAAKDFSPPAKSYKTEFAVHGNAYYVGFVDYTTRSPQGLVFRGDASGPTKGFEVVVPLAPSAMAPSFTLLPLGNGKLVVRDSLMECAGNTCSQAKQSTLRAYDATGAVATTMWTAGVLTLPETPQVTPDPSTGMFVWGGTAIQHVDAAGIDPAVVFAKGAVPSASSIAFGPGSLYVTHDGLSTFTITKFRR